MKSSSASLDSKRLDWIRLARSAGVGAKTFWHLMKAHRDPSAALRALPHLMNQRLTEQRPLGPRFSDHRRLQASKVGSKDALQSIPDPSAIEHEWAAHQACGAVMVTPLDALYPAMLKNLHCPPPVLSLWGRAELLSRPIVAMVGARNASLPGRRFAEILSQDLGAQGVVIVSGLARGIDTAAHRGALASGTIAVLAGGIDVVYPQENQGLYDTICQQGLIVSEQPLGTQPLAQHFPQRNRLISGLAQGVVVIEAAEKSGSLITAGYALEQGRELMAVPGSPIDPRNRGSHALIRQGACLVETADDVLNALGSHFLKGSLALSEQDFYADRRREARDLETSHRESSEAQMHASAHVPGAAEEQDITEDGHQDADTVIEQAPSKKQPLALQDMQAIIVSLLGSIPVTPEALFEGFEAHEKIAWQHHDLTQDAGREQFHLALLELELAGRVHKSADGQICLLR